MEMDATAYRRAVTRQMLKDGVHLPAVAVPMGAAAHALTVDIAWDRPTVAQIKATGAVGVLRYLSNDVTKNIRAQEVVDYQAAGLAIGLVWETTTGRATQGYQAGVDDAKTAAIQRRSVGLPDTEPIHFAVDSDLPWSAVLPYFQGATSVVGKQFSGDYGGFSIIEGAAAWGLSYNWQTLAWSAGRVSSHATLYQYGGTTLGGAADLNYILAPNWGQYPEADMPLTDADVAKVAKATADLLTTGPYRDVLAGAVKYWDLRAEDPSTPLPAVTGNIAVDAVGNLRKVYAAQQAADAKALAAALADIPTEIRSALAAALVHVDVTVTGPTPTGV